MPYSESQKRATMKYKQANYSRIIIDLRKDKKEEYKAQAAAHGLPLATYIISLLEADKAASGAIAEAVPAPASPEGETPDAASE